MTTLRRLRTLSLTLLLASLLTPPVASAADDAEQKDLVDKSRMTLNSFLTDTNMDWFREHIKDAKGIFIVPQLLKAAFFFGGEGEAGYSS